LLGPVPGLLDAWCSQSDVDPLTVAVRSAPWWLPHIRSGRYSAIALPWGIYIQAAALRRAPDALAALVIHELAHIDQWRRLGVLGFARRYAGSYVRQRRSGSDARGAYRSIELEVEARETAERVLGSV
jgi:hypothetical protein